MIFIEYEEKWLKILASKIDVYVGYNYTLEDLSQSIFFDGHFCFEEDIYKESKRKIIENLIGVDRFYKILLPNLPTISKYICFDISFSIPITEDELMYIELKELPLKVTRIDGLNPIII